MRLGLGQSLRVSTLLGAAAAPIFYAESTAYSASNEVRFTELSNAIPNSWAYYTDVSYVTFKSTLTSIGESALRDCYYLFSVTLPDTLTSIEFAAFSGSGLTSLTIPNSVTSIGNEAFTSCNGLTSVTIGSGVTSIGLAAFYNCQNLTSVTIVSGVTSIGDQMFSGCYNLTSVTIPNSVTSMGNEAFQNCFNLLSVTMGTGLTSIPQAAFKNCNTLNSISFGINVQSILNNAFENCGMTSVTIPNSVTSLGNYAFSICSNLTSVTIPISVATIGDGLFISCAELSTINCYTTRTVMAAATASLLNTAAVVTINVRTADTTWTAGSDTIGGKVVNVVKTL